MRSDFSLQPRAAVPCHGSLYVGVQGNEDYPKQSFAVHWGLQQDLILEHSRFIIKQAIK